MANLNDTTEGLFLISEGISFHIEQQKKEGDLWPWLDDEKGGRKFIAFLKLTWFNCCIEWK